jgi:hypothetical protein
MLKQPETDVLLMAIAAWAGGETGSLHAAAPSESAANTSAKR